MIVTGAIASCIIIPLLFFRTAPFHRLENWLAPPKNAVPPAAPPKITGAYTWDTRSSFRPVRQDNVANKSIMELCASFPQHLLCDIQPVLKTGHGVVDIRVRPQLHSVSACLSNLLIFSDVDEEFEGRDLIDVIADIPARLIKKTKHLKPYRTLQEYVANDSLADATETAKEGWRMDRFKFLAGISRAWRMRPDRRWYIFYEADTYIVWDNVFRLLENFDADTPLYFGSPSPGREKTWFANGGPGYIISREAMRRLVENDWDPETGEYLGSKLTEKHWRNVNDDCCGDSILGWALWKEDVPLSGLWPLFNPHPPHGVPFSDLYWCQPVLTMHKPLEEDTINLWRWQWEHRELHVSNTKRLHRMTVVYSDRNANPISQRPLLYRDLAISYFNLTTITSPRASWDNAAWDAYPAPGPDKLYKEDPHKSLTTCNSACEAHPHCFQWRYHLQKCTFVRSFRLGIQREPQLGVGASKEDKAKTWSPTDLEFTSGWNTKLITAWVESRPCEQVDWVRPSTERIF